MATDTSKNPNKMFLGKKNCTDITAIPISVAPGVFGNVDYDPANPPTAPIAAPAAEDSDIGDTYAEVINGAVIYYEYVLNDAGEEVWEVSFIDEDKGCCTYINEDLDVIYNPEIPPTAPIDTPANPVANDTLIEVINGATVYYTFDGTDWVVESVVERCCPKTYVAGDVLPPEAQPVTYTYIPAGATDPVTVILNPGDEVPAGDGPDILVTGNKTVCVNGFATARCVDGGLEMLRCDGSGICVVPTLRTYGPTSSSQIFNLTPASTSADLEAGTESCVNVIIPKCGPHNIDLFATSGFQQRDGYQGTFNMQFQPQFSIDGGATWQPYGSGGIDGFAQIPNVLPAGFTSGSEHDFTDYANPPLPSGPQTICSRVAWPNGSITAGEIQVNTHTWKASVHINKCCTIPAPAV